MTDYLRLVHLGLRQRGLGLRKRDVWSKLRLLHPEPRLGGLVFAIVGRQFVGSRIAQDRCHRVKACSYTAHGIRDRNP